ncbi:hypothetical protein [Clostridium aquiflavi]|uniref:EVE domain-containing protein n=1 Tax=Clostridium aquiflavi TaxID=3073603 RepID=A0ABU1EIL5_9CLOT|nr:hypothetical protein [Clostridium sp. 5N-1]MDR5588250.1 hypothetical protein [Clostridium sp. 5N-1]
MRVAIAVNVDCKNQKGYDIVTAYKEKTVLQFAKRKSTDGLNVGDIVYLWLTKPISNFMYKCEVVEIDSKEIIDDTKYYYNCEQRKQIINKDNGIYSLKLINKIDEKHKDEVNLKQMKALNLTKMNHVQCCCKDKNHKDMFDYLDEKFNCAEQTDCEK